VAIESEQVRAIVERVLERLETPDRAQGASEAPQGSGEAYPLQLPESLSGALPSAEEAVRAAGKAFDEFSNSPVELRESVVAAMRRAALAEAEKWARAAVEETGLGRAEDKVKKNRLAAEKTPGVEALETFARSGDRGLTIEELAPWGVAAAILPSTNPTATVINNAISLLAAGNAVVFNPHPAAAKVTVEAVRRLNAAVVSAGGPANLLSTLSEPTVETARELMAHPDVPLLVVTGGPGVVRAAFAAGKPVVAAGPGNPPVVVDETADIEKAARAIVEGAGFDNNIVCVDEKEIICVDSVADELKEALAAKGALELPKKDWARLADTVLAKKGSPSEEGAPKKTYVGKDASVLLTAIGNEGPAPRILFCEAGPEDPFLWTEQLMPAVPLVRVGSAEEAIDLAKRVEGGRRHTAVMHSKNIEKLSKMAREMDCSIFVKNGPAIAGIGAGGEGHASFTIAGPTGEGVTSAASFVRRRRCVLVDYFRIV